MLCLHLRRRRGRVVVRVRDAYSDTPYRVYLGPKLLCGRYSSRNVCSVVSWATRVTRGDADPEHV